MLYFDKDDENNFQELMQLYSSHGKLLTKQEQNNISVPMIAFCISKVNDGKIKYKHILFEICKNMAANGVYYLPDGLIDPVIYKITVRAGAWIKKFDWSHEFLEKHKDKLNPEYQKDVYYYSLSFLDFMKGDYQKSLKNLSYVRYHNIFDKVDVNRLLMKIYYEMELTEELFSLTETYKHFLHNDKLLSPEAKSRIYNFTNFLISAYRLKTSTMHDYDVQMLKKQLEQTESYEKDWLFEKLEELKK